MTVERVKLAKVVDVKGGKRLPAGATFSSEPTAHPYIRGQDIRGGRIRAGEQLYITEVVFEKIRRYTVREGDVCVTIVGNIGDVGVTPPGLDGANLTENAVKLIPTTPKLDSRFLAYALLSPEAQQQMKLSAAGAAQPKLGIYKVNDIEIPLPAVDSQRRIAAILSAYDDLIENNTRRIAILEEMARRIYEEWFVRFRFPGHDGGRMVESELGLVPEGWETVRMEDVCARITDGSHYSPKSIDAGKPMASVKDMHDWGIYVGTCRQIAEDEYEKLVRNDCKPRLNDVLIAKDGSYLKHTFVVDQEIDLVILSSIAILRPNGRMLPNQLAMYLRLPDVASRMKGYVSGVAIPRIVLRDFRQFLVLLPTAKVQREWAAHCDPMLRLCRNLVRKNENLRTTRDLLLPKLISGELDVATLPELEALAA